jgi:hypothetical protein
VFASSGITDEAVPAGSGPGEVHRVCWRGLATSPRRLPVLASTTLDFTTIPGIAAGKWLKIDSTTSGFGFATAANNTYIRCHGRGAHMRSLATTFRLAGRVDNGSGKTIRVYFGDQVKNGTTQIGQSIEKGFPRPDHTDLHPAAWHGCEQAIR